MNRRLGHSHYLKVSIGWLCSRPLFHLLANQVRMVGTGGRTYYGIEEGIPRQMTELDKTLCHVGLEYTHRRKEEEKEKESRTGRE